MFTRLLLYLKVFYILPKLWLRRYYNQCMKVLLSWKSIYNLTCNETSFLLRFSVYTHHEVGYLSWECHKFSHIVSPLQHCNFCNHVQIVPAGMVENKNSLSYEYILDNIIIVFIISHNMIILSFVTIGIL